MAKRKFDVGCLVIFRDQKDPGEGMGRITQATGDQVEITWYDPRYPDFYNDSFWDNDSFWAHVNELRLIDIPEMVGELRNIKTNLQ